MSTTLSPERIEFLINIMRPRNSTLRTGFQQFLEKLVPRDATFVEVGCFAGAASEMILKHLNTQGFLTCVDPWDQTYYNGQWNMDEIEDCFDRLNPKGEPRLHKMNRYSVDAATIFRGSELDVVYIDAEHDELNVQSDIDAWLPKVRKGGLISGHDYTESWPDVIKVVKRNFPNYTVFPDFTWASIVE